MKDIAEHIGVSKNTVSLALRDLPGVSPELKATIRQAAIDMNYAGFGRLRDQSNTSIIVVVPEVIHEDNPFYHRVILGMEQYGTGLGITVVIRTLSADDEKRMQFPRTIDRFQVSGMIAVGNISREYVTMLTERQIPLVVVDNYFHDLHVDCVLSDNYGGGMQATNHLVNMGHRKIGYCGPIRYAYSFFERWMGCVNSLTLSGIRDHDHYSMTEYADNIEEIHSPNHLLKCIDRLTELPTAFFCGNDRIATAMFRALHHMGMRVPDDVSIVGFDNQTDVHLLVPALTTVNVSRHAMGQRAVEMLIDGINGKHSENACLRLYTNLLARDSVRRIPDT